MPHLPSPQHLVPVLVPFYTFIARAPIHSAPSGSEAEQSYQTRSQTGWNHPGHINCAGEGTTRVWNQQTVDLSQLLTLFSVAVLSAPTPA